MKILGYAPQRNVGHIFQDNMLKSKNILKNKNNLYMKS